MSTEQRRIQTILDLTKQYPATSLSGMVPLVGLNSLDDCAVLPMTENLDLVIGSDFVRGEGFHLFRKGLLSRADIGYYLVGANASDLAAMGATPLGVVVAARYTSDMSDDEFKSLMQGVTQACSEMSIPLLGGDTGGYEAPVLSAAAIGTVPHNRALLRSGAKVGDVLFLSGSIGVAGTAIAYFMRAKPAGFSLSPEEETLLLDSWQRVSPAILQGKLLTDQALSRCAIDTSDGLKASCRQIAEASDVTLVVKQSSLPVLPVTEKVAEALSVDVVGLACSDSVDFRLLFTTPRDQADVVRQAFDAHTWPLHEIGWVEERGSEPVLLDGPSGKIPIPGVEWSQSETMSIDQLR